MKHCAQNHLLVHKDDALLAILLIILNQLTQFEAPIYNDFRDILFVNKFSMANFAKGNNSKNNYNFS